jgi:hypothetical protein
MIAGKVPVQAEEFAPGTPTALHAFFGRGGNPKRLEVNTMRKIVMITIAMLVSTIGVASAQVTTPTPGQPGAQVAPGFPNSSDRDPNNPAASRDAERSPMGTTGSGASSRDFDDSQNLTGPQTSPAEKSPQRNDPTPDRQNNTP